MTRAAIPCFADILLRTSRRESAFPFCRHPHCVPQILRSCYACRFNGYSHRKELIHDGTVCRCNLVSSTLNVESSRFRPTAAGPAILECDILSIQKPFFEVLQIMTSSTVEGSGARAWAVSECSGCLSSGFPGTNLGRRVIHTVTTRPSKSRMSHHTDCVFLRPTLAQ